MYWNTMHNLWPSLIHKTLWDIKISANGVCNTFKWVSITNNFLREHRECNGRLRVKRWFGNHICTGNFSRRFFTRVSNLCVSFMKYCTGRFYHCKLLNWRSKQWMKWIKQKMKQKIEWMKQKIDRGKWINRWIPL